MCYKHVIFCILLQNVYILNNSIRTGWYYPRILIEKIQCPQLLGLSIIVDYVELLCFQL